MKGPRGLHLVPNAATPPGPWMPYRPYTRALLRRYLRIALDIGRLPSILGGLSFRARVSSYRISSFEDAVIFVHDVEKVFERVDRPAMEIIAGVLLLDYTVPEAALRMGITAQRAERRLASALDTISELLVEVGLLRPIRLPGQSPCILAGEDHQATELPPRKPPTSVHPPGMAPRSGRGPTASAQ